MNKLLIKGEKMIIIALLGKLRSGKGTVAQSIKHNTPVKVEFSPLSKPIYDAAYKFYQENDLVWDKKDRHLLEAMGQALNEQYPQGDKIALLHKESLPTDCDIVIIDDVRRSTQYDYLNELGAIFIRVEASREVRKKRCEIHGEVFSEGHVTDTELDNYHTHYVIDNNGDGEFLNKQVVHILKGLSLNYE